MGFGHFLCPLFVFTPFLPRALGAFRRRHRNLLVANVHYPRSEARERSDAVGDPHHLLQLVVRALDRAVAYPAPVHPDERIGDPFPPMRQGRLEGGELRNGRGRRVLSQLVEPLRRVFRGQVRRIEPLVRMVEIEGDPQLRVYPQELLPELVGAAPAVEFVDFDFLSPWGYARRINQMVEFLQKIMLVASAGPTPHDAASDAVHGANEVFHDVEGIDADDCVREPTLGGGEVGLPHVDADEIHRRPLAFRD